MLDLYKDYLKILEIFQIPTTPSELIKIKWNYQEILIKRDDLLPLGCSKQRGIAYMIYSYLNSQNKKYCISSTGNAAGVATYISLHSPLIEKLIVYLSTNIPRYKLQKFLKQSRLSEHLTRHFQITLKNKQSLEYQNIKIVFVENPRREAILCAKKNNFIHINTSRDNTSINGYKTLAYEIYQQIGNEIQNIKNVFVPASTGATAIGIYLGFIELGCKPRMHIIQTTQTYSLIKTLIQENVLQETKHPCYAINDYVGTRRKEILDIINDSQGQGWVISSIEVQKAVEFLKNKKIQTTYDSALSLAAFIKSNMPNSSLLIFTG